MMHSQANCGPQNALDRTSARSALRSHDKDCVRAAMLRVIIAVEHCLSRYHCSQALL